MTSVQPDLDPTLSRRFAAPAEDARVRRTVAALEANGITREWTPDRITVVLCDEALGY